MTIIIDAYNFIKHISKQSFVSDREIYVWIERFKDYVRLKANRIVLVFDAGPYMVPSDETYGNVTVVYSGQKYSADDIIKQWLVKNRDVDVLLVTSDREIRDFASEIDIASVGSDDFYKIFERVMHQELIYEQKVMHTLHKTSTVDSLELDELMERSSRFLGKDVSREEVDPIRIRNGKKISKQDKRILKKLEKI